MKQTRSPRAMASAAILAASRGVRTGNDASRGRAVVASTSPESCVALCTSSNLLASSSKGSAPEARSTAASLVHMHSGEARRRSQRPKLSIARAVEFLAHIALVAVHAACQIGSLPPYPQIPHSLHRMCARAGKMADSRSSLARGGRLLPSYATLGAPPSEGWPLASQG